MKRIIQIKLLPTAQQAGALEQTMRRFNTACNWVAECAFESQLANSYAFHKVRMGDASRRVPKEIYVIALTAKAVRFTLLLFRRLGAYRRAGSIRLGLQRGQSEQCSLPH